jgi:hypothetical protein
MAELYWAWQKYDLSEAAENIGDVYGALAQEMQRQGWSGVQHQEDVHGFKSGIDLFAAVVFLYIGGRSFWQVIAVGGGSATAAQAQQEIKELQSIIAHLAFL